MEDKETEILYEDKSVECDEHHERNCLHDGTILFIYETIFKCLNAVYSKYGHDAKIGKITVTDEFDLKCEKFAPKEKPYLRQRTTVRIDFKKMETEE